LGLQSIEVSGDPLGDTIEAVLSWNVPPPRAIEAAPVAGLPLTPETIVVNSTPTSKNALRAVAHDFAETALLPGRSRVRQTHTVPRSASKAARFD
jgi:hypothetical protein